MKDYEIKDAKLNYMKSHNPEYILTYDMAKDLNISHEQCMKFLKLMHQDGQVEQPRGNEDRGYRA